MSVCGVAEEEIEGGVAGVGGDGLLLDGSSAEDGGADALEGIRRDAFGGDFRDLLEQLGAGEIELLGRGGEVEGEEAAIVAEKLGGTDAVGEAELLADAPEERPGHVGGMLLDEGERVSVGSTDMGAGVADGEHGLLLG